MLRPPAASKLPKHPLSKADLRGTNLAYAHLIETNFEGANLSGSTVYGASSWNLKLEGAIQSGIRITRSDEPPVSADNIEVAQFLHMLLYGDKIKGILDSATSKIVLLLGRFGEPKAVLDAIRDSLRRNHKYIAVEFDFAQLDDRDMTETITTLARLARFVVADLTAGKSIQKELEAIVPFLAIPVKPIIQGDERPFSMFGDNWKYEWVLSLFRYDTVDELIAAMDE